MGAACAVPPPDLQATPSAVIAQTATPPVQIAVAVRLLQGDGPGQGTVVGLVPPSEESVVHPRLLLRVLDGAGNPLDSRTLDLPVDPLPAGAGWPFVEHFNLASPPRSADATLVGDATLPGIPAVLSAQTVRTFVDVQGQPSILGRILPSTGHPQRLARLGLLGVDSTGGWIDVLEAAPGRSLLSGDSPIPYLAVVPAGTDAVRWEAYPVVVPVEGSVPDVAVSESAGYTDKQGNFFVTAVATNRSALPVRLRLTAVLSENGAWLTGQTREIPVAVAAGERAAVTFLSPASDRAPVEDETEVDWRIVAEAEPAPQAAEPLAVEVIGYEPVGSALNLRVGARLPASKAASVAGVLRTEDGAAISADWAPLEPIDSGPQAVAVLTLPLPGGFDLTRAELSVQGWTAAVP
jgi:hypothetical protein